jgi:two-component system, cell cycle sensor histidine kinase and response regulator CckA
LSPDFKDEEVTVPASAPGRVSGEWARIASTSSLRKQSYLFAIAGPRAGKRYRLSRDTHLGRDATAHIQLQGSEISRRHLHITMGPDGECLLEDLGARNGTRVNGVRVDRHALHPGDIVQIGDEHGFLFVQHSALEDLILQEQRMESIARVTAGLAHEFNNLMTVVLTELEYLRGSFTRGLSSREEALDGIKAMDAAARRALTLTQQALGFGRRGHAESEKRPVDLQALADEVVGLLKPSFSSITFRLEVPPDTTVNGDAGLLHLALMNICLHACEEMVEGGALALRIEAPDPDLQPGPSGADPYVVISVQDSGPGRDEQGRQKLFEPLFGRATAGSSGRAGLAAAYEAVSEHGGRIEVDSAPGWGTTFRVLLPSSGTAPREAKKPTDPAGQSVSRTVLLVEDVEAERVAATEMLQKLGLRVLSARDGREAIRLFTASKGQIDLVVLDMILPNVSGKETFRWLRKLQPHIKVLLTSGYLDQTRVKDLLDAGALGFLPKPYEAGALRAAVERALASGEAAEL